MEELVFEPLNMKHSFIYEPTHDKEPMALSYNSKGVLQEVTELDLVYGDKNVYTTARDLLRFDKGTYSNAFLSKRMKAEMFKGYSYERPGKANYGLGIRIREEKGKTALLFPHRLVARQYGLLCFDALRYGVYDYSFESLHPSCVWH